MNWAHAVLAVLIPLAFLAGSQAARPDPPTDSPFHDIRTTPPVAFQELIDPGEAQLVELAGTMQSIQDAYDFVRDHILLDPSLPAEKPAAILARGASSCLGKATLLISLYRAMGCPASAVRVITCAVMTPSGPASHAYVDLEVNGTCLQQDPTDLIGRFEYDQFPGNTYVRDHVAREYFCFNDQGFEVVSQLNRFRPRREDRNGALSF